MTRERRPIPARALIVGAILAVAALGLTIVGGVTFLAQRDRTLTDIDERLISQIEALDQVDELRVVVEGGAVTSAQDTPDEFTDLEAYLRAAVLRLIPGRNEASIAVIDGRIAFRSANTLSQQIADDPDFVAEAVATARPADPAVIASARIGSTDVRYIAVPVNLPGDDHSGVYIRAVDVTRELEPVTLSLVTYTAAALATLAAIGIVGWFVAGRILSPIRRMRETADSITPTDLRARIPAVASTRDIGIAELDRMTRLVEDIDLLSSAEGDQFEISLVDVRELTERMGDLVGGFPGHSWSVAAIARGVIEGDYDRLLQAWLQLADNAAKYTPQGSPIEIGSTLDIASVHLWVRDHGPGIPPAARRRIFHRFARADHRTVGGSGLGLAIVDAIAKAHLGTCAVTDTEGGGATFTITLPITQGRSETLPSPVRAGDVVLQREATG
jgi:signal transduction histidine kinase